MLEDALPDILEAELPVAIVDGDSRLLGLISKRRLARALVRRQA